MTKSGWILKRKSVLSRVGKMDRVYWTCPYPHADGWVYTQTISTKDLDGFYPFRPTITVGRIWILTGYTLDPQKNRPRFKRKKIGFLFSQLCLPFFTLSLTFAIAAVDRPKRRSIIGEVSFSRLPPLTHHRRSISVDVSL